MTDTAVVQRTVRRCTAVVVATIGVGVFLVGPDDATLYGLAVAWLGAMYVAASLFLAADGAPEEDGLGADP